MTILLRPMNTGELLDRTFFLYRKHFLVFAGIAALPQLLLLLLQIAMLNVNSQTRLIATLSGLAFFVVVMAAIMMSQAATVIAVSKVHLDEPTSISSAYKGIKDCWLDILLLTLFLGLGVAIGFVLLIVPGILLALAWSLAIPVLVIEKKALLDSISRSSQLTKGNRFKIFIIITLVALVTYIAIMAIQVPVIAIMAFFTFKAQQSGAVPTIPVWVNILNFLGSFLSSSIVMPLGMVAISLVYYNQRVNKEGFDLQLMMSSLKSKPETQPIAQT